MKRGRRLLLGGLAGFIGTTMASVGGQQAQPPAGGAYTAAQAQAGQAAYARQCAGCHSADLRGSGDAPAVAGPDFIAKWGSRAVNELFTYVVQSMPPTNPGSLGEAGTLEVTAYLLQINGALAGQQPLTPTVSTPMKALLGQPSAPAPGPTTGGRGATPLVLGAGTAAGQESRWGISESGRDRSRRGEELRTRDLRDDSKTRRPATG